MVPADELKSDWKISPPDIPGNIISTGEGAAGGMWAHWSSFRTRLGSEAPWCLSRWHRMQGSQRDLAAWPAAWSLRTLVLCSFPSCPDSPDDWTSRLSLGCMCVTSRNEFPSHAATNFIKSTRWCHLWQVWGQVRQAGGDKVDQQALKMPLGLMILWGLVTPEEMAEVTFRGLHLFTQEMVVKSLLCCWARPQTVNKAAESCPCGAYTAVISWGVTGDPHCLQAFLVLVLSKKAQESLASNPSVASNEGKCLLVPSLLSPLGLWTRFALACTSLCQHSPLPTLMQGVPTSPLEFRTGVPQTSLSWPLATGPGPAPQQVPLSLCISLQPLTDSSSPSTLLHQGEPSILLLSFLCLVSCTDWHIIHA